jgi:hypothetical protein
LYLKQRFGDCSLPPSSGKKPTQLGPIDRAKVGNAVEYTSITEFRKRWKDHPHRMGEHKWPKTAANYKPIERKTKGDVARDILRLI